MPSPLPTGALVLAAGLGTRLRPLTEVLPKPAMPVLGRPLAAYALVRLFALGLRQAVLNTHHLAERLETILDAYTSVRLPDLRLLYSREEPQPLGTGGALVKARPLLGGGTFVVWNGDVLTDIDLVSVVRAHRQAGAAVTLVLVEHPEVERYGAVQADSDGRVVDLAGLGAGPGGPSVRRGVFTGIQVAEPALLDTLPASGVSCVVRQGHVPLMAAGARVQAVFHPGSWTDLGTPRTYLQAHRDLLRGDFPMPTAPTDGEDAGDRSHRALFLEATWAIDAAGRETGSHHAVQGAAGARLEPPFLFGPGCSLGRGACIGPDAVLGARVRVGRGGRVRRAVCWSGVEVGPDENVQDAIAWVAGGRQERLSGLGRAEH